MDVNKIRIITAVHGRQEVVSAFFWQLEYLRKETGFNLPVTVSYSDDDDFVHLEQYLTDDCEAIKTPNKPLSEKHNQLLRAASRKKGWKCLMHLGSDDLVSAEYIRVVAGLKLEHKVYGVNELYFFNLPTKTLRKFEYLGLNIVGAGRVFPRSVVNALKGEKYRFRRPYYGLLVRDEQYVPKGMQGLIEGRTIAEKVEGSKSLHCLWLGKKNSGLDNESNRVLSACGIPRVNIGHYFDGPQIVDLKSRDNITPWERITGNTIPSPHDKNKMLEIAPNIELYEA